MATAGYSSIINVDYSGVVIRRMTDLHKDIPALSYLEADCRDMRQEFPTDGVFDLVLDKGTMDAMLCGAQSVESSSKMLHECYRSACCRDWYSVLKGAPEWEICKNADFLLPIQAGS